jgi:DUF2934 family protein
MQYYYDTEGVLRPTQEELQKRAYELYLRRGPESGHELDDWLRAENELCRLSEEQCMSQGRQNTKKLRKTSAL